MDPCRGATAVPVNITVLRGNNLRGSKNEQCLSFVRAEFNGSVLGDSQKLCVPIDECVNYNFTCSFKCSEEGHTLDDLAHKPLILTVLEFLPKEKKQKEEKTFVLGQAAVDLLPLLHSQSKFSSTVLLHPAPGAHTEAASQDEGVKPTLEVTVSVPEPLHSDSQLSESNLLSVTVETAYSVPEVWTHSPGQPFNYVAALQVPLTAEKEQILLFSNGVLKTADDKELAPRPRKWPLGELQAPDAQFIPGLFIEGEITDLEHGDLSSTEDQEFHVEARCNKKRVSWDTVRRCFLDTGGVASLIRRIAECRLVPVEIMRSPQTGASKTAAGKAGKEKPQGEDEIQIPFHGVAYVDLAPLLYPGARCIRGAYKIHPFYDSDLFMKAKKNMSVLRESFKVLAAQGHPRPPSSVGSCKAAPSKVFEPHKAGRETKEVLKKTGNQGKPEQSESVTDTEPQVNTEGQMFADSRSHIVIEVALEKPLVPKRLPEELAKRVMELIPPKPPLPRRPAGAERAVQEYQTQIASVVAQVLEQYQQMFGAAFVPGAKPLDPATQGQRKSQLFGELNCSGKYFALKEQIKYSVVRIVREKMLRTEAFTDQEQLQAFLSQLYVFLVDEMHIALNKTLSAEAQELQPQPLLDCGQFRHLAREAQLNEDYQLAAQYYQEQLAREQNMPSHWFDYGVFYMVTADYLKAEECFHKAVSVDQTHVPSLLMSGILSEMNGCYENAETYFEGATCVEPSSVVAWTLLGLFYVAQENFIRAEMAFTEATKQLRAALLCRTVRKRDTEEDTLVPPGGEEGGEIGVAVETEAETEEPRSQSSQVIKTEENYKINASSESVFLQHPPTRPNITIYMETVKFLLQNYALTMAHRALAQELLCPEGGPSGSYHMALAHVNLLQGKYNSSEASLQEALTDSFQLGELTEAEDALSEANTLNNGNPEVWGYLSLVCLQTGRKLEAEQSYKYALKFKLADEALLQEIRELQDHAGFGNPCFP
ncbi:cilia- and flagella-associated protein 70 isoform X2 [Hoplias malabaricus]|uniref:cilia- and flagella-associated protein 70 isoform X2 n=1 Tax=Hoplias malabaricus TaxID=27720 RepID=UPI0034618DB7